ncbi:hypothetical protein BDD12DRAFT_808290 [Trichophaea hybrida]|nr:hypothetical protein BDD12DRAFT_808290 [Trichophaea hybrida]
MASERGYEGTVQLLLDRGADLTVRKSTTKCSQPGCDRNPDIEVTEGVLVAVANVCKPRDMERLLARNPNTEEIAERVMTVATRNNHDSARILELLLDKNPNVEITEAVLAAAAENEMETMAFLLARDLNLRITEAILVAASGRNNADAV